MPAGQHLIRATVCALALTAACRTSDERVAAGDTAGPDSTAMIAMRKFDGDTAEARRGRELFLSYNCYGCHGGLAGGAMGPSLRDTVWKFGGTDAAISSSIHDGRPAGMPRWAGTLSPEQITALVTYIRSLRTTAEPTFFWQS